jgi:hypothetical protein
MAFSQSQHENNQRVRPLYWIIFRETNRELGNLIGMGRSNLHKFREMEADSFNPVSQKVIIDRSMRDWVRSQSLNGPGVTRGCHPLILKI